MLNTVNPYHAGYGDGDPIGIADAPFAGRQEAFARLYARLFDPVNTGALLFLGRQHIGKTALLLNADTIFKESTTGVYIPLRQSATDNEAQWLLALANTVNEALIERGFTLSRLSQLDPIGDQPRTWLETVFLPQVLGAVHGKLLLLLDDAERLTAAVRDGKLPSDTFGYLRSLVKKFQNLYVALSLDTDFEEDIDELGALVAPTDVIRLGNFSQDETQWLLQAPVRGLYSVPDECAQAVHKMVGGAPGLVQHFGYEFFRRWETYPELNVFTLEDIKALTPALYIYSEGDYRALWERLGANERLVLTAISDLVYNDPLGRLDAAAIQGWLVETDFPLDITAINSTLRSLEYREVLMPTPQGISLSATMMQSWLLENARLGRRTPAPAAPLRPPPPDPALPLAERITPRLLRILAVIFIVLIIANVLAYVWVNSGTVPPNIQPTVTLAGSQ
jgi:hypothetical protein